MVKRRLSSATRLLEQLDVEPAECISNPRLQEQSRTMIRHQFKTQDDVMLNAVEAGTSVQAVKFVYGISQDWGRGSRRFLRFSIVAKVVPNSMMQRRCPFSDLRLDRLGRLLVTSLNSLRASVPPHRFGIFNREAGYGFAEQESLFSCVCPGRVRTGPVIFNRSASSTKIASACTLASDRKPAMRYKGFSLGSLSR
jgi:hypothetical protein